MASWISSDMSDTRKHCGPFESSEKCENCEHAEIATKQLNK